MTYRFNKTGGSVSIEISKTYHSDNKILLNIFISDTGIGIEPDNLDSLFQSFHRTNRAMLQVNQGTGQGMALSKAMVAAMKGKIQAKSECGLGTSIFMEIPFSLDK